MQELFNLTDTETEERKHKANKNKWRELFDSLGTEIEENTEERKQNAINKEK